MIVFINNYPSVCTLIEYEFLIFIKINYEINVYIVHKHAITRMHRFMTFFEVINIIIKYNYSYNLICTKFSFDSTIKVVKKIMSFE